MTYEEQRKVMEAIGGASYHVLCSKELLEEGEEGFLQLVKEKSLAECEYRSCFYYLDSAIRQCNWIIETAKSLLKQLEKEG